MPGGWCRSNLLTVPNLDFTQFDFDLACLKRQDDQEYFFYLPLSVLKNTHTIKSENFYVENRDPLPTTGAQVNCPILGSIVWDSLSSRRVE